MNLSFPIPLEMVYRVGARTKCSWERNSPIKCWPVARETLGRIKRQDSLCRATVLEWLRLKLPLPLVLLQPKCGIPPGHLPVEDSPPAPHRPTLSRQIPMSNPPDLSVTCLSLLLCFPLQFLLIQYATSN
jgi:hypothetical protein